MSNHPHGQDVTITISWDDIRNLVTQHLDEDTTDSDIDTTTANILDELEGRVENLIDAILSDDTEDFVADHTP